IRDHTCSGESNGRHAQRVSQDKPRNMDRTVKIKSPMSQDHYATMDMQEVDVARFNCKPCHVPWSNAALLVESTYR
ncbi:MAG: nitrate reductase cytochrome c-type subunit, partial [Gammaproteobacteria bacterium]